MGPPTISADQVCVAAVRILRETMLQWGRRRSRRIKFIACLHAIWTMRLQWGRRRSRRIKVRNEGLCFRPHYSFNGAADDLGGSSGNRILTAVHRERASMGPPTISADQGPNRSFRPVDWSSASMGPPTISADQGHSFEPGPDAGSRVKNANLHTRSPLNHNPVHLSYLLTSKKSRFGALFE